MHGAYMDFNPLNMHEFQGELLFDSLTKKCELIYK